MSGQLIQNGNQGKTMWMCIVLLVFILLSSGSPVWADQVETDTTPGVTAELERQQQLQQYSYFLWQRINEARNNPQAVLERLDISADLARSVLGEDSWVLERGLAPLAWNQQLQNATQVHGRDMFDQLYYSHTSLDGSSSYDRMIAAGYQPVVEGETLGALVFSSFIDVKIALDAMLDVMLRDELTGVSGVQRNIFSPDLTEVGISFFAEAVEFLEGQPYVYLLVLDFATPVEPKYFIIGSIDMESSLAMENSYTGFWEPLALFSGGLFQVAYPEGGATLTSSDLDGQIVASKTVYEAIPTHNHYLDLREPAAGY